MSSTYSFQEVTASIAGPGGEFDVGAGAANSDDGISIEMAEDKNTMTVGADGNVMHSLHAGKSGQVTISLLKTSPYNAKLQALYDLQTVTPSLHGKNVIVVRMPNVGDLHVCRGCAFKKSPAKRYKKDGEAMEWVFDAAYIDSVLGTF